MNERKYKAALKGKKFANKAERKRFKKQLKKSLKQSSEAIQSGLQGLKDFAKDCELNSERWDGTRKHRPRHTKDYVPFEMEFGASKVWYNGKRCTRSKQYKYEG